MKLASLVAVIALVVPAVASSAEMTRFLGTLMITGEFRLGDYDALAEALKKKPRRISVSSPGGNVTETIRMATAIRASGLPLQVSVKCLSACASLVFLAASKRAISWNSFVAFHAGNEGLVRDGLLHLKDHKSSTSQEAAVFEQEYAANHASYREVADGVKRIHAESGVAAWLWDAIISLTTPPIERVTMDKAHNRLRLHASRRPRCDAWVPDAAGLAEIGVKVPEFVRPDKAYIAATLSLPQERIFWGALSTAAQSEGEGVCEAGAHVLPAMPETGATAIAPG